MQAAMLLPLEQHHAHLLPCDTAVVQHQALQSRQLLQACIWEAAGELQPVMGQVEGLQLWQLLADADSTAPAAEEVVCEVQLLQTGTS